MLRKELFVNAVWSKYRRLLWNPPWTEIPLLKPETSQALVERLCCDDASLASCRDVRGATPLHAAAAAGAGSAVGALLRHGADATLRDAKQRTPRAVAEARGFARTAQQLDAMTACWSASQRQVYRIWSDSR